MVSRRQVLKMMVGGGAALYLAPATFGRRTSLAFGDTGPKSKMTPARLAEISPIDRTLSEIAPRMWFSDYPEEAHKVLWDKAGFIQTLGGKLPEPREKVPLVIVGGGMSGLGSAWKLRSFKPIILDQAPRFGGNAKGQSWHGVDYSIGAAYVCVPEAGDEIDELLKEIGIRGSLKEKNEEDPVAISGSIFKEFWSGETAGNDEKAKAQFKKLAEYFKAVLEGTETKFPEIPLTEEDGNDAYVRELDKVSFRAHLEKIAGEPLHPHIETAIEQYCWSSMGGSATEISAAGGLNFYAAEFGGIGILPGGNSAIAERFVERLARELPPDNFRPNSLVFDVKVVEDGVLVSYRDGGGHVTTIHAKAVVMACPKFVVGRVLNDIEPDRLNAIHKIKYRSYLVANVLLKGGYKDPFYDLYMLGSGKLAGTDAASSSAAQKVTDVILATYAKANAGNTVLTLYRGMPYDGARAALLAGDSYGTFRAEFEKQIQDSILPLLKIKPEQMVDLRVARWGHPLPVSGVGMIADGTLESVRKPFGNRVFFIEQDNWALPAFETAIGEVNAWAPEVEKVLKG